LALLESLTAAGHSVEVEVCGERHCSVVVDGFLVELKQCRPHAFGSAILFMTGSGDFNKQMRGFAKYTGFKLSQHGLFNRSTGALVASLTEQSIFNALGIEYVAPSERSLFRAQLATEPMIEKEPATVAFVPATSLPPVITCRQSVKAYAEQTGDDEQPPREGAVDDLPDPIMCGIGRVFDLAACHA
jgi:hypothetical protein